MPWREEKMEKAGGKKGKEINKSTMCEIWTGKLKFAFHFTPIPICNLAGIP